MTPKLDFFPRKWFAITMSDGTVHEGYFGTWALARFGEKKKLSLLKVIERFEEPQTMDLIEYIVCAIEFTERESGKPPTINDIKFCRWIDDYTTETGESGVLMKLWAYANSSEEQPAPNGEKKTEISTGEPSNATSLEPVAQ